MSTFNKFQPWSEYMVEAANLDSDQFVVALTNSAPSAAYATLSQITEVSYTNLSGATPRNLTKISSSQSGGTYSLVFEDLTLTASGSVGPFRYIVIYDDTVTGDPLAGWYDYGSEVTMSSGETFLINFGANVLTVS